MIVFIVTLALAVGTQAQICCVPAQWEGTEGTIIAVSQNDTADPTIVTGAISVAYDATNKRVAAMLYMSTGGYNTNVGVILNYAQGIQYTVSGNNCTRTPLGPFVPNCIPSDAKLQRSSYMGPPSNKMMINSYTYMRGQLEVGVTVTANTCVPVGEMVSGQTGNEFVIQSVGFSNITPGISKADSFTPPTNCVNSPIVQANLIPMQGRLLRRYLDLLP